MKKILLVLIAALLIALPMYARSIFEARRHLLLGVEALNTPKHDVAVVELRKALAWNSPGNIYARDALAALRTLGFDSANPEDLRLRALRELQSGLRSSRSIINPASHRDEDDFAAEVRAHIERLTRSEASARIVRAKEIPDPRFTMQVAAQLAFWGWLAAVVWSIFRGFKPDGSVKRRELVRGLCLSALCYFAWLLALATA